MYEKTSGTVEKKTDGSVCGKYEEKKRAHDKSAVSDKWQKSEQCR